MATSEELIVFKANLRDIEKIKANLHSFEKIKGTLTLPEYIKPDFEHYKGPYRAIPKWNDQILETNKKVMDYDVTLEKIPTFKTENIGGGYTVVIGGNE